LRRIVIAISLAALVLWIQPQPASSQSASTTLVVTANVIRNCTIATTPINFGAYDPVAANATTPLDGVGSIIIACTRGTGAHVGLSNGGNNIGSTRRMQMNAVNFLTYEIYKNAGRSDVWGNDFGTNLDVPNAPSLEPRTYTAYGRVPAAQDASVGAYTDVVVASVDF
jgi:spore coat protein U-like protein